MSNDVYKPVRYGTGLKDGDDKVQFWRVFLKHYANPLNEWIKLWPQNPPIYRLNSYHIYFFRKKNKNSIQIILNKSVSFY